MTSQLEVLPGGAHLVANSDGVIIVVAHRLDTPATVASPAGQALTALLGLVDEAGRKEKRPSGRVFARLATNWLMGLDDEDSVEFGVLTPSETGLAVFLHGGVTAVVVGADRSEVLRGRDAGFTVDRVVMPAPAIGVGVFVDEGGASRESLPGGRGIYALGAGTVPGAGVVLWSGESGVAGNAASSERPVLRKGTGRAAEDERQAVAAEPVEAVSPAAPAGSASALDTEPVTRPDPVFEEDFEETLVPAAEVVARAVAEAARGVGPGAVVKGFKCSRHHLNDPRVSFCAVCGIRMDQLTCVLTDGVRPPLGLLLLDDGTSIVLDTDCVLGREPEHADAVARGARPIRLADSSGGMSRAHAEIRLVNWDVTVVDHGSANGTFVRRPGQQEWTRTIQGHPTTLVAGAQVLLGGRVLTFDSQHTQF
ncbi:FHA domain-containing protein [Nocardia sp. GCM10030253]|uniref:FHA domain-containing protein n=1 Tax=Nocardia sp. GCM10030253 TaxID=3273404 RepID=UPI00363BE7D6